MAAHIRIPKTEITGLYGALVKKFAQKKLGKVPESLQVLWHHKPVLKFSFGLGQKSQKWGECDPNLKSFAHMAVASLVGCSACLDIGYFQAHNDGLDVAKAREVPRWHDSEVFTALEREVMAYAEAMSQTPPTVTDEMSAKLLKALGAPGLLELTAAIALANYFTRNNIAIGAEAEGLASSCGLPPLAERPGRATSAS